MQGLYPIIDVDTLDRQGLAYLDFAGAVLSVRPSIVQLRAKRMGARDTLALLNALGPMARQSGAKLYANDRPDLARLAGCDGVHLGQADLPAGEVRRCFPELELGLSTHTLSELEAALEVRPTYIAYGPIFGTSSKENPETAVGLEGLAAARRLLGGALPLVAIGGIDRSRLSAVRAHADLVAVIGALLGDGSDRGALERVAQEFQVALAS